jgi:succinate dehydrogenase/fumarate reductase iron-sulfur protein
MDLQVSKFDPSADSAPKLVTISGIQWKQHMTVLEAIQFAHEITPVAFDYSCHGRACGRCAVMLDGTPVLACVTPITNATHTIEPLAGVPVIRDLIVDKSEAHAALTASYQRVKNPAVNLNSDTAIESTYNTQYIEQINAIEWCARCMVCTAACPVYKADPSSYIGPAAMLPIAYRYYDAYDAGNRVAEAVQSGLWNCIMCGQCDYVCPQKEIKRVSQIWVDLRTAATAAGSPNPYSAAHPNPFAGAAKSNRR